MVTNADSDNGIAFHQIIIPKDLALEIHVCIELGEPYCELIGYVSSRATHMAIGKLVKNKSEAQHTWMMSIWIWALHQMNEVQLKWFE